MSVDAKDAMALFEKRQQERAQREAKPRPLMQQVEIAQETGDPHLDKLLRHIAAKIEEVSNLSQQFANEAMRLVDPNAQKAKQLEYMATQGALKVLMELAQIPAQIVAEAKSTL
jgi:hypothetical protein